eukprot:m.61593 g.61593  ORF g.61593 m.61593 type:complete len:579 (+) comp8036_c1_seq1:123-1859(+)
MPCPAALLLFQGAVTLSLAAPHAESIPLTSTVVVNSPQGPIRGVARPKSTYFKGIPYAQPPIGDLRWRPPQPVSPWTNTLDATEFKPSCLQAANDNMGYPQPPSTLNESCLYLNVYAPPIRTRTPSELRPVIFWIYGGGFQGGGGNETRLNGTWDVELFPDEVVIVTHNYRLNVFGFLGADELRERDPTGGSTGNYGIQDQRAAMKWVHDNIHAFGGDPSRVLIVGQSAGADSVAQHLVRNASWPYFAAAGMESGAFYDSDTLTDGPPTVASVRQNFLSLAKRANCSTDHQSVVACLVGKPALNVFQAATQGDSWTPTVDGADLPAPGPVLAAKGTLAPVPVFAGYVAEDISDMRCCGPNGTEDTFVKCAVSTYGISEMDAHILADLYRNDVLPPGVNGTRWYWAAKHAGADSWGGCPARRIVNWVTQHGHNGYFYRWSHTPYNPADGGAPGNAHHALEQPFVFHVLNESAEELKEDKGRYFIYPKDEPLSRAIVSYWLSMARDGRPSPGVSIGPAWPPWSQASGQGLVIGDTLDYSDVNLSVVPNLRKEKCDFFDRIFFNTATRSKPHRKHMAVTLY